MRKALLIVSLASCATPWPLHVQRADIKRLEFRVPFVPSKSNEWPLWLSPTGALVGGSGFRLGRPQLTGVSPGLGLGSLLMPWPLILPSVAPSASPAPTEAPSPPDVEKGPWLNTHWGPIPLKTGPVPDDNILLPLGFPPAEGTPVTQSAFFPFLRLKDGAIDPFLYDQRSRTLYPLTALIRDGIPSGISQREGFALVTQLESGTPLQLIDLLTGSVDTFPELADVAAGFGACPSRKGQFIAFTAGEPGRFHVYLFDRQSRAMDRLAHLNVAGSHFRPSINADGRYIAYNTVQSGNTEIHLYDTITGLVDTLPEISTPAQEFSNNLDDAGRWLTFVTLTGESPQARLFDRLYRAIDPLPDLNRIGTILSVNITGDGRTLFGTFLEDDVPQGFLYDRYTGFIDRVPQVNLLAPIISL